ncbi:MAG: hypothetical protein ACJAVK_002567 [Akkermansiaceae bacterium]|jgi:hypothetical protein
MGLGDWYLRALPWRTKFEKANEKNPPKFNLLDLPYLADSSGKHHGSVLRFHTKEHDETCAKHHKMVRNDQGFADGFTALGDHLSHRGHLNLGFLADTRAMNLGHQNPVEIRRRRRTFLEHAKYHFGEKRIRSVQGLDY